MQPERDKVKPACPHIVTDRTLWHLRRLVVNVSLTGEADSLPAPWDRVIQHLGGLPPERRVDALSLVMSGRDDGDDLLRRMTEIDPRGPAPTADAGTDRGITISANKITTRPVEWLWPGRIPRRKITLLAGDGGTGKTTVMLGIIAALTRGGELPDGGLIDTGSAIYISSEDDPEDTIVPRLKAAGADLSRVHLFQSGVLGSFTLSDVDTLKAALKETRDVRMVVIDPASAHLGSVRDNDNSAIRSMLAPLVTLVSESDISIILIAHFSKSDRSKAVDKILGSVGWTNVARSVLICCKYDNDCKDQKVVLTAKCNLSSPVPGIKYRIAESQDGPTYIEWGGTVEDVDADELLGTPPEPAGPRGRKPEASTKLAEWLYIQLSKHPYNLTDLVTAARNEKLINESPSPLYNAKDRLQKIKVGTYVEEEVLDGRKVWRLSSVGENFAAHLKG